jgi:hypothetical protein
MKFVFEARNESRSKRIAHLSDFAIKTKAVCTADQTYVCPMGKQDKRNASKLVDRKLRGLKRSLNGKEGSLVQGS